MKPSLKAAGIAVAITLTSAFTAQAGDFSPENSTICNGHMYGGNYIANINSTATPVDPMHFNIPAGENLVANVESLGGNYVLITPSNPNRDCDSFMNQIKENDLIQSIEPNWIQGFDDPIFDVN